MTIRHKAAAAGGAGNGAGKGKQAARPCKRAGLGAAMALCLSVFSGVLTTAAITTMPAAPAFAQNAPSIIRDTEIENWLREWATPVMKAAGLNPDSVKFILVHDAGLNAFVAGGQNVFIYTGLILRTERPEELLGVIAHELGHIRGGHLIRTGDALERAGYESVLGVILGIGTALVTGSGQAAAAVMSGTSSAAAMRFLSFSRQQESSADQAALTYLEAAGISPEGLVTFMRKLEDQELLPASQQVAYIRTHPLTADRVATLESGLARSSHAATPPPAQWADQHARMKAKLIAFLSPERVAWDYSNRDQSTAARYARTIAAYRENHVDEALRGVDTLLAAEPNNAYLHELKGQMLLEFGRVAQSLPAYKRAVALDPKSSLIRAAYGHALIESARNNDKAALQEAITQLERARADEPRDSRVLRFLATAYGRLGQDGVAKLYLAEEAVLKRQMDYARRQAEAALAALPAGSRHHIMAQDLLTFIQQNDGK